MLILHVILPPPWLLPCSSRRQRRCRTCPESISGSNQIPTQQLSKLSSTILTHKQLIPFITTMQLLAFLATVTLLATLSLAAVIPRPQHELRSLFNASLEHHIQSRRDNIHTNELPTGAVLNQCTVPGTVALTFDDGPYIYTPQLLDTLSAHHAIATFFLNGMNKGSIAAFPDLVRRTLAEGHQLGSHSSVPLPPKIPKSS